MKVTASACGFKELPGPDCFLLIEAGIFGSRAALPTSAA
jgi:hypothetical protein